MEPSKKTSNPFGSDYFLMHKSSPNSKKDSSNGELFLKKADGSLISMPVEIYSNKSKFKKAKSLQINTFSLEVIGESGKEYVMVNLDVAKQKLGNEFAEINKIEQDKSSYYKNNFDPVQNLPEVDQHLQKIFKQFLKSNHAIEILAGTNDINSHHAYTVVKGNILLHLNEKLGEGGFKTVKLAKNIFTNEFVVIAQMKSSINFATPSEEKKGMQALVSNITEIDPPFDHLVRPI